MEDQQAKQKVEKLGRRDFLKGKFPFRETAHSETKDDSGSNIQAEVSEAPIATKLPKQEYNERKALQKMTYGLYILTTGRETKLNAITCNWVTQISFNPLLILVAIEKESYSHQLLQEREIFALNFLDKTQSHLARRLAVPHKLKPHKLAGIAYHEGASGVPILDEALAWLECEVKQILEVAGDHTLFIGEVLDGNVNREAEPLTLIASGLRYK